MKNKWENYALKDGKVKESYIREYSSRSPIRKLREGAINSRADKGRESQDCSRGIVAQCPVSGTQPDSEGQTRSFTPGHQTGENERITNSLRGKDETSREEKLVEAHQ